MEMEFRLASKSDLTPNLCQQILTDAQDFLKDNPIETLTAGEILAIFVNFCEGRIIDPQFWLSFKDGEFTGYMITNAATHNKQLAVYVRGAYIHPLQRGNGIAPFCLDTLERQAKASGAKHIILQTDRKNPKAYARFMGKFGYQYMCTRFIKEI